MFTVYWSGIFNFVLVGTILWQQLTNLFNELPNIILVPIFVANATAKYPGFISADQITMSLHFKI